MKYIKLFEDHNWKIDRINSIIRSGGFIKSKFVKNLPDHNIDDPIRALSIDDDGLITVDVSGKEYEVDIENVEIERINESLREKEDTNIIEEILEDFTDEYQCHVEVNTIYFGRDYQSHLQNKSPKDEKHIIKNFGGVVQIRNNYNMYSINIGDIKIPKDIMNSIESLKKDIEIKSKILDITSRLEKLYEFKVLDIYLMLDNIEHGKGIRYTVGPAIRMVVMRSKKKII